MSLRLLVSVAEWSKACGSGPYLFGGAGSNPATYTLPGVAEWSKAFGGFGCRLIE